MTDKQSTFERVSKIIFLASWDSYWTQKMAG